MQRRTEKFGHRGSFALPRRGRALLPQRPDRGQPNALHNDNVTWYAAATRQFPKGRPFGEMIRATVPVTTDATEQVGQAVIKNLLVAGGTVRFDVEAAHAATFTCLQKRLGETVWSVLPANTPEASVTPGRLAPGEHRFKAFGANAQGIGPESAEAVATIAPANAA
jgi:hypothetical protein